MATAPKQPRKPREDTQADRDRKLRENIALEYATREFASTDEHIKFLDAVYIWVKQGIQKGEARLKVVGGEAK